jgi:hypothetical protein
MSKDSSGCRCARRFSNLVAAGNVAAGSLVCSDRRALSRGQPGGRPKGKANFTLRSQCRQVCEDYSFLDPTASVGFNAGRLSHQYSEGTEDSVSSCRIPVMQNRITFSLGSAPRPSLHA